MGAAQSDTTDWDARPRYIALLDALGFTAMVLGGGQDGRLRAYLETLRAVLEDDSRETAVDYVVFSDNIVLTTSDTEQSLKALISGCSRLLGSMLENEIALRGAITFGSY